MHDVALVDRDLQAIHDPPTMKVPVVKAMFLDEVVLFRVEVVLAQDLTGKVVNAL